MAEYTITTEQDRLGRWGYNVMNDKHGYISSGSDYRFRFSALCAAKHELRVYLRPHARKRKEHKYRG